MAAAYKCDRCGKLFEEYSKMQDVPGKQYGIIHGRQGCILRHLDLCASCYEALIYFMNEEEETK